MRICLSGERYVMVKGNILVVDLYPVSRRICINWVTAVKRNGRQRIRSTALSPIVIRISWNRRLFSAPSRTNQKYILLIPVDEPV